MNKTIKICLTIPSLQAGGMERVMSEIAWDFAKRKNVELHLIMFGKNREIFYDIPDNIVIHKPVFKFDDKYRTLSTIRTIFFIRKEIKKIDPDKILSFGEIWNSFVQLSLLGTKYDTFVSDRCRPDKSFGKLHDYLRKKLYSKAKGVIAQTAKAKEIYSKQFHNDNVIVIGNPIRDIKPQNIERENIIVSVGRLIDTKNFDQLINIFSKIENKNWKLIIIGGNALKQNNSVKLQQQINDLNLNEKIFLAGTQKDVESYLLKSKIFAFTSSSEGFPNVIGEAMSAGLPVVAYDCIAGPSDMIKDENNGYLIPLFDQELFVNKLNYLINNEEIITEMGNNARDFIIKNFSTKTICEQYFNFITK
jgi:GalNAc-alpha-(1->4)-GalNAc-alpha-(1->3)-diNAcBac-PP-undecaprenol alpha-1,4-N-acetyl-D-galactosaminyltransferase